MLIPNRGLVWLAIVPLVLAVMVPFDESMLWPMLAADAGMFLLAVADALMTPRKVVTISRRSPEVFSLGRHNVVTVEVRSQARRRMRVELTCELFDHATAENLPMTLDVPGRGRVVDRFKVIPRRRGAHAIGDTVVRYPSPLGLWKRQVRFPGHHAVRVYPDVQAVRTFELLARQDRQNSLTRTTRKLGGESEFEQLRDYSRDDEFRSIDWKATARRGKLTARQYQLESNQNLMFLLDGGRLMSAETSGLSLFDHALNATLMLAHIAARGGDRVGLISYAEEVQAFVPPAAGRKAVQTLIAASYALHPALVESDSEKAFHVLNLRVRKRTLVVLFTQVIDERSADELIRFTRGLAPRHLPLIVLFRDVEVHALLAGEASPGAGTSMSASPQAASKARIGDVALYERGAAAELIAWRDQLLRTLKNHGALVLDVDPSDLTPALINRYLEIKARHLL